MRFITTIGFSLLTLFVLAQESQTPFSFAELKKPKTDSNVTVKQFASYDDTELNYYQFTPEKAPVAILVFIHGGGAHSKLGYFHLAQTLRDSFSIETILLDLRGHGFSQGDRGDCPEVRSLNKDISFLIQKLKGVSDRPIYLGGHSSGGGLVLNYSSWKKSEKLDGYIFISPELGYKSDTERKNRIEFAEVKVWKFVVNGVSQGSLLQHSKVIFFNYPQKVISQNPLILQFITVNMSKAMTPKRPIKQFENITEPVAIFVGEKDELFAPEKVTAYALLPLESNKKTTERIIQDQNHLSILNGIGNDIGETILKWQLD